MELLCKKDILSYLLYRYVKVENYRCLFVHKPQNGGF